MNAGQYVEAMAVVHGQDNADAKQVGGTHYKGMAMQPWQVMEAVLTKEEFIGFLKGNIIKYSMRAGHKADSDDAGKARHYKQKLDEVLSGQFDKISASGKHKVDISRVKRKM